MLIMTPFSCTGIMAPFSKLRKPRQRQRFASIHQQRPLIVESLILIHGVV